MVISLIKRLGRQIPEPLGALLTRVLYGPLPFYGKRYLAHQREIQWYRQARERERRSYILERVRRIVKVAYHQVPFYHALYRQAGVRPEDIRGFEDIARLPIVTKAMLRAAPLAERSAYRFGRCLVNTGGSTGETLSFYTSGSFIPCEWAHMHTIWARIGFHQSDLKACFAGLHVQNKAVVYDGLRHHYWVNVCRPYGELAAGLRQAARSGKIKFLHGYPSALHDFACYCEEEDDDLGGLLRRSLAGILLSSEFPFPRYRETIERVFEVPSISWYGHTERAILAGELHRPFHYEPFQTYGYCEAVPDPQTGEHRLIGTSYYNEVSPFIRYDTGDLVEPEAVQDGILQTFRIKSGREGEFILDRHGNRIPLSGLIYGRHHRLLDRVKFIQIREEALGKATVLVTASEPVPETFRWEDWFDGRDVAVDFKFECREQPVRSPSGKVLLKVGPGTSS